MQDFNYQTKYMKYVTGNIFPHTCDINHLRCNSAMLFENRVEGKYMSLPKLFKAGRFSRKPPKK